MRSSIAVAVAVLTTFALVAGACGGDDATTPKPLDGSVADTTTKNDGSGNPDSSGNPDTSIVDGSGSMDSSDSASNAEGITGLPCGSSTCNLSTTSCCVAIDVDAAGVYSCAATSDSGSGCPTGTASLKCRSALDCPGSQFCCTDSTGDPILSACMSSCPAMEAMLCDPSATDVKNRCGDAGACSNASIDSWNLPDTFGTCGGLAN